MSGNMDQSVAAPQPKGDEDSSVVTVEDPKPDQSVAAPQPKGDEDSSVVIVEDPKPDQSVAAPQPKGDEDSSNVANVDPKPDQSVAAPQPKGDEDSSNVANVDPKPDESVPAPQPKGDEEDENNLVEVVPVGDATRAFNLDDEYTKPVDTSMVVNKYQESRKLVAKMLDVLIRMRDHPPRDLTTSQDNQLHAALEIALKLFQELVFDKDMGLPRPDFTEHEVKVRVLVEEVWIIAARQYPLVHVVDSDILELDYKALKRAVRKLAKFVGVRVEEEMQQDARTQDVPWPGFLKWLRSLFRDIPRDVYASGIPANAQVCQHCGDFNGDNHANACWIRAIANGRQNLKGSGSDQRVKYEGRSVPCIYCR